LYNDIAVDKCISCVDTGMHLSFLFMSFRYDDVLIFFAKKNFVAVISNKFLHRLKDSFY